MRGLACITGWLLVFGFSGLAEAGLTGKICKSPPSNPDFPVATCQLPECPKGQDCVAPTVDKGSVRFGEPYFTWKANCRPHLGVGCWDGKFPVFVKVKAADGSSLKEVGVRLRMVRGGKSSSLTVYGPATLADGAGYYRFEKHLAEWVPVGDTVQFSVERFCARDRAGFETCVLARSDLTPEPRSAASPENRHVVSVPPAPLQTGE